MAGANAPAVFFGARHSAASPAGAMAPATAGALFFSSRPSAVRLYRIERQPWDVNGEFGVWAPRSRQA